MVGIMFLHRLLAADRAGELAFAAVLDQIPVLGSRFAFLDVLLHSVVAQLPAVGSVQGRDVAGAQLVRAPDLVVHGLDGADLAARFRTLLARVEIHATGSRQLGIHQEGPNPDSGPELGRDQEVVPAHAAQAGHDGSVLEKGASLLHKVVHGKGLQAKVFFHPLPQGLADLDQLPVARGAFVAVPPIQLRLGSGMFESHHDHGLGLLGPGRDLIRAGSLLPLLRSAHAGVIAHVIKGGV